MPLYEYVCESCDHRFEAMQALSTKPEDTACPKCQMANSRRIMSSFASKIVGTHKTGFSEIKGKGAGVFISKLLDHGCRFRKINKVLLVCR